MRATVAGSHDYTRGAPAEGLSQLFQDQSFGPAVGKARSFPSEAQQALSSISSLSPRTPRDGQGENFAATLSEHNTAKDQDYNPPVLNDFGFSPPTFHTWLPEAQMSSDGEFSYQLHKISSLTDPYSGIDGLAF